MTNIKALDKLREVVRCGQGHGFSSAKAYYEVLDGCITEIEHEIVERFVELPVDADGVLVHVGDVVQGLVDAGPVQHMELWDDAWVVVFEYAPGRFTRYSGDAVRHVKPRTLEDVLREYRYDASVIYDDPEIGGEDRADALEGLDEKVAAEIRGLLGVSE